MRRGAIVAAVLSVLMLAAGCGTETTRGGEDGGSLTVYSGRNEKLVGPIIERFEQETGVSVSVKYGDTAELAATILEEGDNSPADVFFGQDAGALGSLANAGRFARLPDEALNRVPERFRSPEGLWVGTSGRARVLVYNTDNLAQQVLPDSVLDLTGEEWEGRVGWAPTNGSFQAFVTALRRLHGDDAALAWLRNMENNGAEEYDGNSAIVQAVATGEIDAGLVNHYYLLEIGSEDAGVRDNTANHFFPGGDVGSLVNVAGLGILNTAPNAENALRFVNYMLSRTANDYFAGEVYEYPLAGDLPTPQGLPDLEEIQQPDIDLADLDDLQGTLDLMRRAGVL